jgi:hypothetical protein
VMRLDLPGACAGVSNSDTANVGLYCVLGAIPPSYIGDTPFHKKE